MCSGKYLRMGVAYIDTRDFGSGLEALYELGILDVGSVAAEWNKYYLNGTYVRISKIYL